MQHQQWQAHPFLLPVQKQAKNESSFASIHIFQDLAETTASRIQEVETLLGMSLTNPVAVLLNNAVRIASLHLTNFLFYKS